MAVGSVFSGVLVSIGGSTLPVRKEHPVRRTRDIVVRMRLFILVVYVVLWCCTIHIMHRFFPIVLGVLTFVTPFSAAAEQRITVVAYGSDDVRVVPVKTPVRTTVVPLGSENVPVISPTTEPAPIVPASSSSSSFPHISPPLTPASLQAPRDADGRIIVHSSSSQEPGLTEDSLSPISIAVSRPQGSALLLTSLELSTALASSPKTLLELTQLTKALVQSDKHIESIQVRENGISITRTHTAKLFGFISTSFSLEITIDDKGVVKVQKPLWLFIAADSVGDIKNNLEQRIINGNYVLINTRENTETISVLSSLLRSVYDVLRDSQ
jgi:hypothetical protein